MIRAGVAAIGTTVQTEIDIQAVQGDTLPVLQTGNAAQSLDNALFALLH